MCDSDSNSDPGRLVMDLSFDNVSDLFSLVHLLTVDYFQQLIDTPHLEDAANAPEGGVEDSRVRRCRVLLHQHLFSPRTPSHSPPRQWRPRTPSTSPPRVRKPVRYADPDSESEESLADLSSDSGSLEDPTVQPGQLSSSDHCESDSDSPTASSSKLLPSSKPVPKVLNNLASNPVLEVNLITLFLFRSSVVLAWPGGTWSRSWVLLVMATTLTVVPRMMLLRY